METELRYHVEVQYVVACLIRSVPGKYAQFLFRGLSHAQYGTSSTSAASTSAEFVQASMRSTVPENRGILSTRPLGTCYLMLYMPGSEYPVRYQDPNGLARVPDDAEEKHQVTSNVQRRSAVL